MGFHHCHCIPVKSNSRFLPIAADDFGLRQLGARYHLIGIRFHWGRDETMWQKRVRMSVAALIGLLVVGVLFPMILHVRETARRTHSTNNLKQIGLALSNYADVFHGFPPGGIFNAEGRGYQGWMTSILPFMDASPFYTFVDFNQPWDSTTNAGLFLNNKPNYENPGEPQEHRHWEFPVAHYSANAHIMAVNSCVNLESVEQQKQVFLVGELDGDFVPWGCPYNWRELVSLNSKPPTYGRSTGDGCQILFADGRVEFVSNDIAPKVLKVMSGDDLSGFNANVLNIQRPPAFPCPSDALWISWSSKEGELVKVRRDIHGNVKSEERRRGK